MQIKQAEQQRKVAKDATDAQLKQEQLTIEAQRQKIEAARAMAQMENTKQAHLLDKSVEVLTHLSNTHQSKASQERSMNQASQQTKEE